MSKISNTKSGSVYPFLDARTPLKGSSMLPVKLSVMLQGKQFRVGLKLFATKDVFDKAMSSAGAVPKEAKQLRMQLEEYLSKAQSILNQFPNIERLTFINLFKSESSLKGNNKTDLAFLFNQKIDELIKDDKAGSKAFYEQALVAFLKYNKEFYLENITTEWLKSFKSYWIGLGNAHASCQMYFRCLRHIYNRAIKQGLISVGQYPFKEFTIGSTSKSKDVLYPQQLKALWDYEPTTFSERRAKDYFFFLYLCNGMNIKDALSLKGSNVRVDKIVFIRSKTESTNHETKEIIVHLHPEVRRIIEEWGDINTKDYIFPCLRGCESNIERKKRKDMFTKNMNRALRRIGNSLGFEVQLKMNLARHSYATRLKIDGVSTSLISDSMGHSSSAVTEHYLKSIPDAMAQKISESLLKF